MCLNHVMKTTENVHIKLHYITAIFSDLFYATVPPTEDMHHTCKYKRFMLLHGWPSYLCNRFHAEVEIGLYQPLY